VQWAAFVQILEKITVQWAAFVQIAPAIPCFTYASNRAMGCFCADSAQRIRVVKTIGPKEIRRDRSTGLGK